MSGILLVLVYPSSTLTRMVETARELRQRQNKILLVVDGHIHVDDAKNREDLAIETDKQKRNNY